MKQYEHSVAAGYGMWDKNGDRKYLNLLERSAYMRATLQVADVAERTLSLTLLTTGCRISEALNMVSSRVDFVERCLVFKTLKRRGTHYRCVPVPDGLLAELRTLMHERSEEDRLWSYSRSTAWRLIKALMAGAEISGCKASPKGLRHSYAIACVSNGVPITTIAAWLGHSRLESTAVYSTPVGSEARLLAERLWAAEASLNVRQ